MTPRRETIAALVLLAGGCSCNSPRVGPSPGPGHAGAADGPAPPPPETHADGPGGHEALPQRVRLTEGVIASAGIKTVAAATDSLPATTSLTGEVAADPDRSAEVTARVAGRISDVHFKEGDRVKPGALLAVVESAELAKARAAYTSMQAKADVARRNAERLARVAAKGLASGQEVASAQAESRALEADVKAARQTLLAFGPDVLSAGDNAAHLSLRAPIDGFILRRDAVRGQTVAATHVIAEIADLDRVYFVGRLFEKDLARVKTGSAAQVQLNAYPGEVFPGTVDSIGKRLDPTARTVVARIGLENRNDRLKVGLFGTATVAVVGAMTSPRLVLPFSAVTRVAGHDVVFVREPDGGFGVQQVTLGRSAADRTEVLSGLREGQRVVVDGVFTLKSVLLKSTFGEGD